jgi:hypothetical protein
MSGGCCDCGDEMAWKSSGFCKKHQPSNPVDMDALLAPGMKESTFGMDGIVWILVWALRNVACQTCGCNGDDAKLILDWLHDLSKVNDAFRVVICDALLRPGIGDSSASTGAASTIRGPFACFF